MASTPYAPESSEGVSSFTSLFAPKSITFLMIDNQIFRNLAIIPEDRTI